MQCPLLRKSALITHYHRLGILLFKIAIFSYEMVVKTTSGQNSEVGSFSHLAP